MVLLQLCVYFAVAQHCRLLKSKRAQHFSYYLLATALLQYVLPSIFTLLTKLALLRTYSNVCVCRVLKSKRPRATSH